MTEFEKIFNDNRTFIFKYLMKMTRDVSLAEELTQDSLRFERKRRQYRDFVRLQEIHIMRGTTNKSAMTQ